MQKPFFPILLTCLLFYLMFSMLLRIGQKTITFYYPLRETTPLIFFCILQIKKITINFRRLYELSVLFFIFLISITGLTFIFWNNILLVQYAVFSIILFELLFYKTHNDFESFTYMLILLPIIGFIYEIPVFLSFSTLPIFVSLIFRRILIMLPLIFMRLNFHFTNPFLILSLTLLFLFSIIYYFNPVILWNVSRIPTFLFFSVLIITSWKKTVKRC